MVCLLAAGCHGNIDQQGDILLELTADCLEIPADGASAVTFTVTYGEEDVTSVAEIVCVTTGAQLTGNTFVTQESGRYVFQARHDGQESDPVEVTAAFVSRFERNVCVMEFTGQWCSWCPEGAQLLHMLVTDLYAGQAYALAFHNDDDFAIPAEADLQAEFGWDSYPAYVTDMRDCGNLSGSGCRLSIESSLYDTETHCAVAVTSEAAGEGFKVTAGLFSERTMDYRMAAYLVEDKIVAWQTVSGNITDEDYVHRHVVRQMLSASVAGDALGNVKEDEEKQQVYSFVPDPSWNLTNMTVAVLAIDAQGHVNNMAVCAVDGGSVDYELKK